MFSEATWQHFRNPVYRGRLPDFNGEGWAGSRNNGVYIRIQVRMQDDVVAEARFETVGCLASIATCQALLGWATSKSRDEVAQLTPARLDELAGGLPAGRYYCLEMALHAIGRAMEQEAS